MLTKRAVFLMLFILVSALSIVVALPPTIQVTFPVNGEIITSRYLPINWTASDPENNTITLNIYLDTNNVSNDGVIPIASSQLNDGGYLADLINLVQRPYYVRIDAIADIDITTDYSEIPFVKAGFNLSAIANNYSTTVARHFNPISTYTHQGPTIVRGQIPIRFNISTSTTDLYTSLFYSTTPGSTEQTIAANLSFRDICQYNITPSPCYVIWNSAGVSANKYIDVAITDTLTQQIITSPLLVVTNKPNITVTTPNGGENYAQQYIPITWNASDITGFSIKIDLFYDLDTSILNGRTIIAQNISNTGFYNWSSAGLTPGQYYLSIDAQSTGLDTLSIPIKVNATDYSNAAFTRTNFNQSYISSFVSNNYSVRVDTAPLVSVLQPNSSATVNTSVPILFSVSDAEDDFLTASLYYSTIPLSREHVIAQNLSLTPQLCSGTSFVNGKVCTYLWNSSLVNGVYALDVVVSDSISEGIDASDVNLTIDNIPFITNLEILNITTTTARFIWQTPSEPTNTTISYTLAGSSITQNYTNPTLTTTHSEVVSGLLGNKKYQASIRSCDATGNCVNSGQVNFTTLNTPQTVTIISPNGGEVISTSTTQIRWNATDPNNDPITIHIYYDQDTSISTGRVAIAQNQPNTGNYTWSLIGLPNGFYYISIDASVLNNVNNTIENVSDYSNGQFQKTALNLSYQSNNYSISTTKNIAPTISNLAITSMQPYQDIINITFTVDDQDTALSATTYYSSAAGIRQNLITIYTDLATQCLPTNITAHTCTVLWNTTGLYGSYFIDVQSNDSITSSVASTSLTTLQNVPLITNISVQPLSPSLSVIRWNTAGTPTNATVPYALGNQTFTANNATLTTSHQVALQNLSGNQIYTFSVLSCDGTGICSQSPTNAFVSQNTLPAVSVVYPNGGETLNTAAVTVLFNMTDFDGDPVNADIYYDNNNQQSNGRILIASNINTGTYQWNIAGIPNGQYYLSIDAKSIDRTTNTTVVTTDYSDASFGMGDFTLNYTSGTYNVSVEKNTGPLLSVTAPQPFQTLIGTTNITFIVSDLNGDSLSADLFYSGNIYQRQIIISNTFGQAVNQYPVAILVDTQTLISQGKLRPDGINLKVLAGGDEIPLYIESGFNTAQTKIWISLDIPQGIPRQDVYLVYGDTGLAVPRSQPIWTNLLPLTNVIQSKPVLSFSSETPQFPAPNANDGNINTKWRSTGTSDFIRYNITSTQSVYKVRILTVSGVTLARARSSIDNQNFSILGELNFTTPTEEFSFKPVDMAYFLVDQIGASAQNDIAEIQAYSPKIASGTVGVEQPGSQVPISLGLDLSSSSVCSDPDITTITPNTCGYFWNLSLLDGTFCVSATVTDQTSVAVEQVCNLTIDNINDFPVLTQSIPDVTYVVGHNLTNAFDLDTYFNDPNNDTLTYTVSGNQNISISIDPVTNFVNFSQSFAFQGIEFVIFSANDGISGSTNSNVVKVSVVPPPATITGLPNQTILEDTTPLFIIDLYNFTTHATLPVTALNFSVFSQSNASLINCFVSINRFVQCAQPAQNGYGQNTITISAYDGVSPGLGSFIVNILAVNDLPNMTGIPDFLFSEGATIAPNFVDLYLYTSDVEDPDTSLNYSLISQTNPTLVACAISANRYVNCQNPAPFQSGQNIINVSVADTQGGLDTDDFVLTIQAVDNPPNITLLSPANNTNISVNTQAFSFIASDIDTSILNCGLRINNVIVSNTSVQQNSTANIIYNALTAGSNLWQIQCADATTTVISQQRTINLLTDLQVSALIANPPNPLQGTPLPVTATILNNGLGAANNVFLRFLLDNNQFAQLSVSVGANSAANFSTILDTSSLIGTHNITAIIDPTNVILEANETNNQRTTVVTVTLDNIPPVISGVTQQPSNIVESTTGLVNISATVTDAGVGVNNVVLEYFLNGTRIVNLASNLGNNLYKSSINVPWNLYAGTNFTYRFNATDLAGNSNITPFFNDFIQQVNDPPQVTIINPTSTTLVSTSLLINWTIFDQENNAVTSTVAYRRVTNATEVPLTTTNATNYLWNIPTSLDGSFQIIIDANDGQNSTRAVSAAFTIDNTAPLTTLLTPSQTVNTNPVVFTYISTDAHDPALRCTLLVDTLVRAQNISTISGIANSINVNNVSEGNHNWQVQCADTHNNQAASTTQPFIVDRTAPVVALSAPFNNSVFTTGNVTFTFTPTDALDTLLLCQVFIDDLPQISGLVPNGTLGTLLQSNIPSKNHQGYVRCADDGNNIGNSAIRNFNITTDVTVTGLSITPTNPQEGTSVNIQALIQNTGNALAQNVVVDIYRDTNISISSQTLTLAAQTATPVMATLGLLGLNIGQHNITVAVRTSNYLDSNPTNNQATSPFTIVADNIPPLFGSLTLTPSNITENSQIATFTVSINDSGVGINPASVLLNLTAPTQSITKTMTFTGGSLYLVTVNATEFTFDNKQGQSINYFIKAKDFNNNTAQSGTGTEFIDIINDIPQVLITRPQNNAVVATNTLINITTNNDNEGLVTTDLYYWQPYSYATPFLVNATQYFQQGQYIFIANLGSATTYLWNTSQLNGYSNVRATVSDSIYSSSNTSAPFVIDNTPVDLMIDNYFDNAIQRFLISANGQIKGAADGTLSSITSISINTTAFTLVPFTPTIFVPFTFNPTSALSGSFDVAISASDAASNTRTEPFRFTVDNQAPIITSAGFSNAFTNDLVLLQVNATDNYGIVNVNATITTTQNTTYTLILNPTNGYYETTFFAPSTLGIYPAVIRAVDHVGAVTLHTTTPLTLQLGPDLTPSSITFTPPPNATGQLTTISSLITNLGGKYANNVNISYRANGTVIGTDTINVTTTQSSSITWDTTGFAGTLNVQVSIENSTGVYESNYANNNVATQLFINGPDLAISNIQISPTPPLFSGAPAAVSATITNIGSIDATNIQVTLYNQLLDNEHLAGSITITVLAGQSTAVSIPWQTAGLNGNTTTFAVVNPSNIPAEPVRSNNQIAFSTIFELFVPEQIPDTLIFPERTLNGIGEEKIRGLASLDFNKDNRTDFVAATDNGTINLYLNAGVYNINERIKTVNFTLIPVTQYNQKVRGVSTADFAFDNYSDLVIGTEDGSVIIHHNVNGIFASNTTLFDAGSNAYGLAITDLDNDNDFDIVVGNSVGQVNFWINNASNSMIFVFNQTITTRDQPYGITTGDFDLDGHNDIMVGDRFGQIERIIFETDHYNGFIFADVGSFAHGLSAADIDYNNRLDLFSTGFDGNIRMYYSRESGLTAEPFIIGNVVDSFAITGGDYDKDNDIDFIVGDDHGGLTMLLNSVKIVKTRIPDPSPALREIKTTSRVENPYSRRLTSMNLTELLRGDVVLDQDKFTFYIPDGFGGSIKDYDGDLEFTLTPVNGDIFDYYYYFDVQDGEFCRRDFNKQNGQFSCIACCQKGIFNGITTLNPDGFEIREILDIFNHTPSIRQREGFTMVYYVNATNPTNHSTITIINYTAVGSFNTPNTDFLLSDDITNTNNLVANVKNVNPDKLKTDRDFSDEEIRVPDFTPTQVSFSGFSNPPTPGEPITATVTVQNLGNIAISEVEMAVRINGTTVLYGCPGQFCRNYTLFNMGALGVSSVSVNFPLPSTAGGLAHVAFEVNPSRKDFETNYDNNNISAVISSVPPADLAVLHMYWEKPIITEGETLVLYANVSNVGMNDSYYQDTFFYGLIGQNSIYTGTVPTNIRLNCTTTSPYYDANMCDGSFSQFSPPGCGQNGPCNFSQNLAPGQSMLVRYEAQAGDLFIRSQGVYAGSAAVGNVGSGDENLVNNANYAEGLTILPSQIEIIPPPNLPPFVAGPGPTLSNPSGNNIALTFSERNLGGFNAEHLDNLIYLDNNDSIVLDRITDYSITNHSAATRGTTVDFSTSSEGDHIIYFYSDYGQTPQESTANATSTDGIQYMATVPGTTGNELTVIIDRRNIIDMQAPNGASIGSTLINVNTTAGIFANDLVRFAQTPFTLYTVASVGANTLTLSTPLLTSYSGSSVLNKVSPTNYRVIVSRQQQLVQQTAFDVTVVPVSTQLEYVTKTNGITNITTYADIAEVLQFGGTNPAGTPVAPPSLISATFAFVNTTQQPALSSTTLAIPGNIAERNEYNNVQSVIFRWKEITISGISYFPLFPTENDVVTLSASVSNTGDIPSGPFEVAYYIDEVINGTTTLSLGSHASAQVTFTFKVPLNNKPTYNFRFAADSTNVIHSEDESNNNATTTVPTSVRHELNTLVQLYNITQLTTYELNGASIINSSIDTITSIAMENDADPVTIDYDGDNDLDLLVGSLRGTIESYENTGNIAVPKFAKTTWQQTDWNVAESVNLAGTNYQTVPITQIDVGARSTLAMADLDSDGLTDMILGDTHGRLSTYKRIIYSKTVLNSSGQVVLQTKKNWINYPFNLSIVSRNLRGAPTLTDIDGDTLVDLFVSGLGTPVQSYKNTGNATHPAFTTHDFGLNTLPQTGHTRLSFADIDSDGDKDVVIGTETAIVYMQNTGSPQNPQWSITNVSATIGARTSYNALATNIDGDGAVELIIGTHNGQTIPVRRGYFEPISVQVVNYANNQIQLDHIDISLYNASDGRHFITLYADGPQNVPVYSSAGSNPCPPLLEILQYNQLMAPETAIEKNYDVTIPQDIPLNTTIGVEAAQRESVNGGYSMLLGQSPCGVARFAGGLLSPIYTFDPAFGANIFQFFVKENTTYEIQSDYTIYQNNSILASYSCERNYCPMYNLTPGSIATISGGGTIYRYQKAYTYPYTIVQPAKPPIDFIVDKFDLQLRPGYIEDVSLVIHNNNRRPYTIDRIGFELYNTNDPTGSFTNTFNATINEYGNASIINLYTDTNGFTLSPEQDNAKTYKIYIPEGVPLNATLYIKAVEKRGWNDEVWSRSNVDQLWPASSPSGLFGELQYGTNVANTSYSYNPTPFAGLLETPTWGKQNFQYRTPCDGCSDPPNPPCGEEETFMRKELWISQSLFKAEQNQQGSQICSTECFEDPSGISTWINGELKTSWTTDCETKIFGHTPTFDLFDLGTTNVFDIYNFGPHRTFDITFYEVVGVDYLRGATVAPADPALTFTINTIGTNGKLRRQYEEPINITFANNDDDPLHLDVVTLDLITPTEKVIHLLTDTTPRTLASQSSASVSYGVIIPSDVPLNSFLRARVERTFGFADLLWNRDKLIALNDLLSEETNDYHWGDTLPTGTDSNYRKHFFAPNNITRAEIILGAAASTDLYLNEQLQGHGYPGWSPIAVDGGLRAGMNNLISVTGSIPSTNAKIYSGVSDFGGSVIDAEEDAFFIQFGIREQNFIPNREPFLVAPGEAVTARIGITNLYNKTLNFDMIISAVDFTSNNELVLANIPTTILAHERKYLEIGLTIPTTVSNETRLQLSGKWNEILDDKNWLRGSNFADSVANNFFLDDASWGVTAVSPTINEQAIYFRKKIWIDSSVESVQLKASGHSNYWVNGLPVTVGTGFTPLGAQQFTKTDNNLLTIKSPSMNIDADILLKHFVPVRSTDLDIINASYTDLTPYSQGILQCAQLPCDCGNVSRGVCRYNVDQGDLVALNVTLRNAGELFSRNFTFMLYAKNNVSGHITVLTKQVVNMHPFSTDKWQFTWNTTAFAGPHEFGVLADTQDVIIETSEFNNKETRLIYVNAKPEALYTDIVQHAGYTDPALYRAVINDQDNNIRNFTTTVNGPNASNALYSNTSVNATFFTYNDTRAGIYTIQTEVIDALGESLVTTDTLDIANSMFVNVKTTKDLYYYGEQVQLLPASSTNATKTPFTTSPLHISSFGTAELIKKEVLFTVQANAYDPDGDFVNLYVCKTPSLPDCTLICSATKETNPSCSFTTPTDTDQFTYYTFITDSHANAAANSPIPGKYVVDAQEPQTQLVSIASKEGTFIDNQDDHKTLISISANEPVQCRFGKDDQLRFRQDRSFTYLSNSCANGGMLSVCNIGDIIENDPARDPVSNLTKAYISCIDAQGNEQFNTNNIDADFQFKASGGLDEPIYDSYDGLLQNPGYTVSLSQPTTYCVDQQAACTPSTFITPNATIAFTQPGTHHLRYVDASSSLRDTTVIINSPPSVSAVWFEDITGSHTYLVKANVSDLNTAINCTVQPINAQMPIQHGIASYLLSSTLAASVSCSDGSVTTTSAIASHTIPNQAPILSDLPDISLRRNATSTISLLSFTRDLEGDPITYVLSSNADPTLVQAAINTSQLLVSSGNTQGSTQLCLQASDTVSMNAPTCLTIYVESDEQSRLKSNEVTNSTIMLIKTISHRDVIPNELVYTQTQQQLVLPGSLYELHLADGFTWPSASTNITQGNFTVTIRAVDLLNNTLINRDGSLIEDSYNFTLVYVNTAPRFLSIPNQTLLENEQPAFHWIDLREYVIDDEQSLDTLNYSLTNQTNNSLLPCFIQDSYYLACTTPAQNLTGTTIITLLASDPLLRSNATNVSIEIKPLSHFTHLLNLTYQFSSDVFDLSGDPLSGIRQSNVPPTVTPGIHPGGVAVSDGQFNVTGNFTITVLAPQGGLFFAEPGNYTISENDTLVFPIIVINLSNLSVSYNASGLPSGAVFVNNASTPYLNWTPTFTQSGNYTISFTVTNGQTTITKLSAITVLNLNRRPVLQPLGNYSVQENATVTIDANATDPDLDPISYSINAQLPSTFTFNSSSGIFSWTPGFNESGIYTLSINATDGSLADEQFSTITVGSLNQAPQLSGPIPPQAWAEDTSRTINLTQYFSDPDNDPLTYVVNTTIVSALVNNATNTVTLVPPFNYFGNSSMTITARDPSGLLVISNSVPLIVTPVNDQPQLLPVAPQTILENTTITLQLNATDIDSTGLTFSTNAAQLLPSQPSFTNTGLFSWTPGYHDFGTYNISFTVSDGNLTDTTIWTLQVTDIDHAQLSSTTPIIGTTLNFSIYDPLHPNNKYTLAFAYDNNDPLTLPDGRIVPLNVDEWFNFSIYNASAINLSNSNSTLDGTGRNYASIPIPNQPAFIGYTVKAAFVSYNTSINGSRAITGISNALTLTVQGAGNIPPYLNSTIPNLTWQEDHDEDLNLTEYFIEPQGQHLNYSVSGNVHITITINQTTGKAMLHPDFNWNGVENVLFRATDPNGGNAQSNVVKLNVTPVNDPVSIQALPAQSILENNTLTINVVAIDVDNDPIIIGTNAAQLLPGPVTLNATTFTYTPTFNAQGSYIVTFNATDSYTTATTNVLITVTDVSFAKVTLSSIPRIGTTLLINLSDTLNPGANYTLLAAYTTGSIPLPDGRYIPLTQDELFNVSLYSPLSIGLSNSKGILNSQGFAQASIPIPNTTNIIGLQYMMALLSINNSLPPYQSIIGISPAQQIIIQP